MTDLKQDDPIRHIKVTTDQLNCVEEGELYRTVPSALSFTIDCECKSFDVPLNEDEWEKPESRWAVLDSRNGRVVHSILEYRPDEVTILRDTLANSTEVAIPEEDVLDVVDLDAKLGEYLDPSDLTPRERFEALRCSKNPRAHCLETEYQGYCIYCNNYEADSEQLTKVREAAYDAASVDPEDRSPVVSQEESEKLSRTGGSSPMTLSKAADVAEVSTTGQGIENEKADVEEAVDSASEKAPETSNDDPRGSDGRIDPNDSETNRAASNEEAEATKKKRLTLEWSKGPTIPLTQRRFDLIERSQELAKRQIQGGGDSEQIDNPTLESMEDAFEENIDQTAEEARAVLDRADEVLEKYTDTMSCTCGNCYTCGYTCGWVGDQVDEEHIRQQLIDGLPADWECISSHSQIWRAELQGYSDEQSAIWAWVLPSSGGGWWGILSKSRTWIAQEAKFIESIVESDENRPGRAPLDTAAALAEKWETLKTCLGEMGSDT